MSKQDTDFNELVIAAINYATGAFHSFEGKHQKLDIPQQLSAYLAGTIDVPQITMFISKLRQEVRNVVNSDQSSFDIYDPFKIYIDKDTDEPELQISLGDIKENRMVILRISQVSLLFEVHSNVRDKLQVPVMQTLRCILSKDKLLTLDTVFTEEQLNSFHIAQLTLLSNSLMGINFAFTKRLEQVANFIKLQSE